MRVCTWVNTWYVLLSLVNVYRDWETRLPVTIGGVVWVGVWAIDQYLACISHVIGYHLSNAKKHPTFGINSPGHCVVWD